jgi:hypothetical protein
MARPETPRFLIRLVLSFLQHIVTFSNLSERIINRKATGMKQSKLVHSTLSPKTTVNLLMGSAFFELKRLDEYMEVHSFTLSLLTDSKNAGILETRHISLELGWNHAPLLVGKGDVDSLFVD